jgi:hypothetical protein
VPFYNVACAEALLGNVTEALVFLNKAIDLGWRDLEKIMGDEDLVMISYTKGFQLAIKRLKEILNIKENEEPVKFQQPEKIPQPVKIPEPVKFQEPEKNTRTG